MALAPLKLLVLPWFILAGGAGAQTEPSPPRSTPTSEGSDPPGETPGASLPPGPETPAPLPATPPGLPLQEGSPLYPLVSVSPEPFRGEEQPELEMGGTWITSLSGRRLLASLQLSGVCTCDLTYDNCDINCCCDSECDLENPLLVFLYCLPGSYRVFDWECIDLSLIYQSNVPFYTKVFVLDDDAKFCVLVNNAFLNYFYNLQRVNKTNTQSLAIEYGSPPFFSVPQSKPTFPSFYKVGDPILIYFPKKSLLNLFKQPTGMGPSRLCIENNPARFLESGSTSCIRFFSNLKSSCTTEPSLRVTIYNNFMVLKVPEGVMNLKNMLVPVTLTSEPILPHLDGNICHNVVSQVIYEIETNGTSGIQKVSVSFILTNLSGDPGASLEQHFTMHFHAAEHRRTVHPMPRSGNPGYIFGMPLLVLKGDTSDSMTISQSHSDGSCSMNRKQVEFGANMMTGCKFRLENRTCDHLQDEIYKTLSGTSSPVYVGIMGNSEPSHKEHWVKIFTRNCSALVKNCTSCCYIPISLEIQIVWAYAGLHSNPQASVLGGRYLYQCSLVKSWWAQTVLRRKSNWSW